MKDLTALAEKFKFGFRQFLLVIAALIVTILLAFGLNAFMDYMKRSSDAKKSELVSKLLWNNINQCFYVELDDMNKYYRIIRVQDCDKTK
jgi:hypothetical protein